MSDQEFNPDWISPPWNTISDAIEEKGVPEEVYINMLGLTRTGLENLKRGDMPITSLFASKLSEAIGSTKEFWLNREIKYRYDRNRIDAETIAQLTAKRDKLQAQVEGLKNERGIYRGSLAQHAPIACATADKFIDDLPTTNTEQESD